MELDQNIQEIQQRNRQKEAEKAWEQSWTRRLCITALIYIIAVAWLKSLDVVDAYWQAVVPTVGYFLSTLSLPWLKKRWITRHLHE